MKKLILTLLAAVGILTAGCSLNDKAAEAVEKSYAVVIRGLTAVDYIQEQVVGSELGDKIGTDLASLENALGALKSTLETIAGFVGADLPEITPATNDPIGDLDRATEDLLNLQT